VERVDNLIDKWGHEREIIVPQYHQQYSDAPCDINILDSIRQEDGSSPQILPCELKYWHRRGIQWKLEPIAFIEDKCGHRREGEGNCKHGQESQRMTLTRQPNVHTIEGSHNRGHIDDDRDCG
jgi:hypothetical protein